MRAVGGAPATHTDVFREMQLGGGWAEDQMHESPLPVVEVELTLFARAGSVAPS